MAYLAKRCGESCKKMFKVKRGGKAYHERNSIGARGNESYGEAACMRNADICLEETEYLLGSPINSEAFRICSSLTNTTLQHRLINTR